ncbi:phosphatase PAP2 family protein [Rufibacter sediminis]|uniref:Phosphatase PAP2 family protein n=1 Tax=Rufibacter sediminis TaxID=2762756 RepID=A0ABR6VME5_9BACT|nr:phosphatase PAP2 family protein [Rufibacter sediminis]MBC3538379.1 phosphatase PAP2 family protein [Rufibacter sediminis]
MKKRFRKFVATTALFTVELIVTWTVFILCLVVFFWLAKEVLPGKELKFDSRAFAWADERANPTLTEFIKGITFLASRNFISGAGLMLIGYFLFVKKHKWYSVKVPVIAVGSITLNLILKYLFNRPRPLVPHLVDSYGLSFPSGHAMISASFYGLLIYLVWKSVEETPWRILLITLLSLLILFIGFSRVYLHVHYATDVLAGLAAGLGWVILALFVLNRMEKFSKRNLNPVVKGEAPLIE